MSATKMHSNNENNNHSRPLNFKPSSLLSPPPDSLSRLSNSINRLTATISGTHPPTDSSRDAYLNSTMSLLNMCNTVSAQIEWLRLRCLKLKFARHLLSSPNADHLSCARKALSGWQVSDSGLGLASAEEVERTNVAVRRLSEAIIDSGGMRVEVGLGEMENLTEELMVGLDRLAAAIDQLFTVVIGSRNVVLDSYKVGPKRCK